MKYKLICSDIDGTLVDQDGRIPEENLKAIKRLREKGVLFAICSGRVYYAASLVARYYEIPCCIVSCNGGIVVNDETDEIIRIHNLPMDLRNRICDIADRYHCVVGLNQRDGIVYRGWDGEENVIYAQANEMYGPKTGRRMRIEQVEDYRKRLQEEELVKLSIWARSEEDYKKLCEEIEKIPDITSASALKWQLEITNGNVSKWTGVRNLMDYYGIRKEEVVCIGDTMNDYPMVKNAGLGIAMANGEEKLKEAAAYVTDTNNNAGLAKAIYACLEGKI